MQLLEIGFGIFDLLCGDRAVQRAVNIGTDPLLFQQRTDQGAETVSQNEIAPDADDDGRAVRRVVFSQDAGHAAGTILIEYAE